MNTEVTTEKAKEVAAKPKEVAVKEKDCFGCRMVGAVGLVGIGAYLANFAWKNKTFLGRVTLSTLSLAFVSLGIARYEQKYPFDKKKKLQKQKKT